MSDVYKDDIEYSENTQMTDSFTLICLISFFPSFERLDRFCRLPYRQICLSTCSVLFGKKNEKILSVCIYHKEVLFL